MLHQIKRKSAAEVELFIKEAESMIEKYGWQEKTVRPYSFNVKVTKIIADLKDYRRCTSGSQEYLISLANGLAKILNSWEEFENKEKIEVRSKKTGKIGKICKEDLEMFADLVEII